TFISMAGVAVGVMALVVVLAVMSGFEDDLKHKILGVTSDIVVSRFDGTMDEWPHIMRAVEGMPGIQAASPFVLTQALLSHESQATGVVVRGIDPARAAKVLSVGLNMKEGRLAALQTGGHGGVPGIVLGRVLARNLGVWLGSRVDMISPFGQVTAMGRMPRARQFEVVGIFESGMFEYDSTLAYMSLASAQRFLDLGGRVSGLEVKVDDIYRADARAAEIQRNLGFPYLTQHWMDMNRNLFSALKLEKVAMFVILTLIVLVAAFNIVSTLIMVVMEKNKDIGILKSMGATGRSIMKIFVYEGLIIGVVGTLVGLGGGLGLCGLLSRYKFVKLPADVYYISRLPVLMEPLDVFLVCLAAVLISLLATLYPAWKASRLDPAEAIRYE
ncbi:MAG: lipoprotein-releasing ABC transporter permease subunit, partial [Pseudomonadota bacterium]